MDEEARGTQWPKDIPPPPGLLNAALAIFVVAAGIALQVMGSRQRDALAIVAAGLAFSFVFLPLYSLLHEAEHRVLHRNRRVNDAFGVVLAAFFPGSFTFLRACHLGHHRRNRSDAEMFDLYYPSDSLAKKRVTFYALYLGGFWLTVPLATILLVFRPSLLGSQLVQDAPTAAAMVNGVPASWVRRIRKECAAVILLHTALIAGLHLAPATYALLYFLFGLNWSAQQYVTHAASPRHVQNGAHNLKAHPLYAGLLLNFNWHLAHHQHPGVPWIHLPRYDDKTRVRPGYLGAFIRFWRGPRPTAERPASDVAAGQPGATIAA
ncbi:MAG: fatty acid desaturase [Pseudomonadota bacterium]